MRLTGSRSAADSSIPDCAEQQATACADQLRSDVNTCAPVPAGVAFPAGTLSLSVGISSTANHPTPAGMQSRDDPAHDDAAGEALFRPPMPRCTQRKAGGRNRVAVAPPADATESRARA